MVDKIIRLFKFDGNDKLAFDQFKDKMLAIGGLKYFNDALTSNLQNVDLQTNAPIAANVKKKKNAWDP